MVRFVFLHQYFERPHLACQWPTILSAQAGSRLALWASVESGLLPLCHASCLGRLCHRCGLARWVAATGSPRFVVPGMRGLSSRRGRKQRTPVGTSSEQVG